MDQPDAIHLALAHHKAGRLDQAEILYRAVLADELNSPDALNLLGLVRQDLGDLAGSIDLLSRALCADPDFPEALTNLARATRASGRSTEAQGYAQRATELDPELVEAWIQLAHAHLDLHNSLLAVDAAKRDRFKSTST